MATELGFIRSARPTLRWPAGNHMSGRERLPESPAVATDAPPRDKRDVRCAEIKLYAAIRRIAIKGINSLLPRVGRERFGRHRARLPNSAAVAAAVSEFGYRLSRRPHDNYRPTNGAVIARPGSRTLIQLSNYDFSLALLAPPSQLRPTTRPLR
uniref:Uncharacterized protein n=1 Tax=Plectus sambesii TaxID=2011161 RepID=A0A914X362_9BILA